MTWLRLLLRVLLAVVVLLALAVAIVLGPLRDRTTDLARAQLERLLAAGLHTPVSIGALRVSFIPLRVEAEHVRIGEAGALAHAARLSARLLPRTSLRQRRPVATATAEDVFVDVPGWVALLEDDTRSGTPTTIPAFRLRVSRVAGARVRIAAGETPLEAEAGVVAGELAVDALGLLGVTGEVETAALRRGTEALALTAAGARLRETVAGWRFVALTAAGDGIALRGGEPTADRFPVRGEVALPRLAFASPIFARLAGTAELDVAFVGRLEDITLAGTVRVPDLRLDDRPIGTVTASAEFTERALTISAARVSDVGDANAAAELSGQLALAAPFAYDAQVRWTAVDPEQVVELPPAIKPFRATGQATVTGTLEPLAASARAGGRFEGVAGGAPLEWSGEGQYRGGGGEARVDARQAGNTLAARLVVAADRGLRGTFTVAVPDLPALAPLVPLDSLPNVSGMLTATADLSGSLDDPRLAGQLSGANVVILGVAMNRLGGAFTLDRAAFRSDAITATLWQGSIAFGGTVALGAGGENAWRLDVVDVPGDAIVGLTFGATGVVAPIGRGRLNARLTGRGPWSAVQISGGASMENFWLTREWIERATVSVDAAWPAWRMTAELRNTTDQSLSVRARGSAMDDVVLDASSAGWRLTALERGGVTEMAGTLTLDAALRGPLRALSGRAQLGGRGLVVSGRPIGDVDVEAAATRGRWELSTALLDGALQVRGQLAPEAGWPARLEARWTDADLGPLLAPESGIVAATTGTLDARIRLVEPARFDATLALQDLHVVNGPYELRSVAASVLTCRGGRCTLDELALRGANTNLRIGGRFGVDGTVALRLNGTGDLRLLELAGGAIESARGQFTVDLGVERVGRRWDVDGRIALNDVALDVGAPVALTRATGRLSFDGTTISVDQFTGRVGTGTVSVGGTVNLTAGPALEWRLTDVGANLMPSLEAELSGEGGLDGSWQRLRLYGDVAINQLLYDRDIELRDFLPRLNRALAEAPRPSAAGRIALDLHVVAPGQLYVENNLARIEARADLRVTGTAERPVLNGRIEALDGTVTVRDRVFELQGATVDFRPDLGLTPALNITLESTIDTPDATYTVDVRVTGTTREPRVTMSSDDPSLSPTDVGTLIAVGKTTAQLREGEGGAGFSIYDALAVVPGELAKPIEQGTKQLLPIDRISFESTYSRTTGTFEPQLKLGKDLTDELSVALGQTFGVESRTSAEADYRLTPRVFLLGTWESQTSTEEGAFGAGVKVRYEFWRVTPYTLVRGWR